MKTYETFYKNLINVLPKTSTPNDSTDILDIDDFMFEYANHLSNMEVKNGVDNLDIGNPKRYKITQDEYNKYLSDPIGYDKKYNDLDAFLNE